jgi:hypothetical protein
MQAMDFGEHHSVFSKVYSIGQIFNRTDNFL